MIEAFLLSSSAIIFTTAIVLFLVIFLLEIFTLILGGSISHMDLDLELDVQPSDGLFSTALLWMNPKNLPISMFIPTFLLIFGLTGLFSLYFLTLLGIHSIFWFLKPVHIIVVLVISGYFSRIVSRILAKIIPRDETYAVSSDSFINKVAFLTGVDAVYGVGAEAKLHDEHGQVHYILVHPVHPEDVLKSGTKVKIVSKREGIGFNAIGI